MATLAAALLCTVPGDSAAQVPGAVASETVVIPGTELVLTLRQLPAGEFAMGSPEGEAGRDPDEGPVHTARLPSFWMTAHEITHAQYAPFRYETFDSSVGANGSTNFDVDAVTRPSPPYEDPSHGMGGDPYPVTGMTRLNALYYARWLSEKTGRLFRLPTEAEWEYACRAGTTDTWGGVEVAEGAWLDPDAGGVPHPVGERRPNAWGLYDLQGNAAEWVMDGYVADAYTDRDDAARSPFEGSATRGRGVVRGGAFDDTAADARCAARYPESAAWKRRDPQIPKSRWWNTDSPHVGFRLVSPAESHTMEEIRSYFDELLGG